MRPVAQVQHGNEPGNFFLANHAAIHAEQAIDFRTLAQRGDAAVGMRHRQVSLLREHDVIVQFQRQALVQFDAFIVKGHALRCAIVRADNRRIPAAGPAAEVALIEHRNIDDAALAQVIGDGETVNSSTDDDDVVGRLQLAGAPHSLNNILIAQEIRILNHSGEILR